MTDDNYNNSGVDHSIENPHFGELKESNFTLNKDIQNTMDANVELYTQRAEKGLDIWTGNPLSLTNLLATRSLGHLPIKIGFSKLTEEEKKRYKTERKHYEV